MNRRAFLKNLLGATSAIVAPSFILSQSIAAEGITYRDIDNFKNALLANDGIYRIDPINSPLAKLCSGVKYGPPIWVTDKLEPYTGQDLIDYANNH